MISLTKKLFCIKIDNKMKNEKQTNDNSPDFVKSKCEYVLFEHQNQKSRHNKV